MNSTKTQSRTGKIARLPHAIRELLNQRLLDNQPGPKICQWLNSLPETKALCKDFAGQTGAEPSRIIVARASRLCVGAPSTRSARPPIPTPGQWPPVAPTCRLEAQRRRKPREGGPPAAAM